MPDEPLPSSLAVIASQYATRVTLYTFVGFTLERILEANPNRWFVEFHMIQGGGQWRLTPGPPVEPTLNGQLDTGYVGTYKYRDCPAVVTGEWFATSILGSVIQIVECVYLR